jgi:hypothetical protein
MVDTERDPQPTDDYDTPWKTALERYLPEFLAFYFPVAHAGIDWSRGWRFLDQELAQVVQDAELGRRWVDKLVAVHRLGAVGLDAEDWIYIHIEIQAGWDGDFPKRMFTYNYRLFDRFDRPVASLAVLADDSPSWRPSGFGFELFGCRHQLDFPLVKLLDHEPNLEALLEDPNPFALVTAAHLLTRRTRGDAEQRFTAKWRLARLLYERGWERQQIVDLFAIIDWLMRLPAALETKLWQALSELERNKTMPYITSVERIGYERGHLQGIEQGRLAEARLVQKQLRKRFGSLPDDLSDRVATLPLEQLERLGESLFDFASLAEVERWLQEQTPSG